MILLTSASVTSGLSESLPNSTILAISPTIIVLSSSISLGITLFISLGNVIKSLIGDDAESGILISDIPSSFVGKTYKEYEDYLWNQGNPGGILVGLLLNTGNFHQRRKDALREAQRNPNVKDVIERLQKVKNLKSNEPRLTPDPDFVIYKNTKAILVKGKKRK